MKNTSPHNEQFVAEMSQKLEEEQAQLEAELKQIAHKSNGDYQSNVPEYGRQDEENASEVADFEAANATTEAIETRLKEVQKALKSIEKGTYGVTEDGEEIPEERLRANPAATTLIK